MNLDVSMETSESVLSQWLLPMWYRVCCEMGLWLPPDISILGPSDRDLVLIIFALATLPNLSLLLLTGNSCCPNPVWQSAPRDPVLVRRVYSERWCWPLHQGFPLYGLDPQSHPWQLSSLYSLSQWPQNCIYHPWLPSSLRTGWK